MNSKAVCMMTPPTDCGFSKEECMELTMAEKRDLIKHITELVKGGVLNRSDRDEIYRVCLVACDREIAKMKED